MPIGCGSASTSVTREEMGHGNVETEGRYVNFTNRNEVNDEMTQIRSRLKALGEDSTGSNSFRWRFLSTPISSGQRDLLAQKLFRASRSAEGVVFQKKRRKADSTTFSALMRTDDSETHIPSQLLPYPLTIMWSEMEETQAAEGILSDFCDDQVMLVLLGAIVYGYGFELQMEWRDAL